MRPYDITIGTVRQWSKRFIWLLWFMDVSVTKVNLINTSFWWVCNLTTHCSVLVLFCLRKTHVFSGFERPVHNWGKRGKAACLPVACTYTAILSCRYMMAKKSLVSPVNSVLLQLAGSKDDVT